MAQGYELARPPCNNIIGVLNGFHDYIEIACHIIMRLYNVRPPLVCNPYGNPISRYRDLHHVLPARNVLLSVTLVVPSITIRVSLHKRRLAQSAQP